MYYISINQNGSWSPQQKLTNHCAYSNLNNPSALSSLSPAGEVTMVISNEKAHLLWNAGQVGGGAGFYYVQQANGNSWLPLETVITNYAPNHFSFSINMEVDSEENVHVVWDNWPEDEVKYAKRSNNGIWSNPILLGSNVAPYKLQMEISSSNTLHAVWWTADKKFVYFVKDSQGQWTKMQEVQYTEDHSYPTMLIDNDDNLHLLVIASPNDERVVLYMQKAPNEYWEFESILDESVTGFGSIKIDRMNNLHSFLIGNGSDGSQYFYYGPKRAESSGSTSISQVITVPLTMTTPILSFMYQLGGMNHQQSSSLMVQVDDGDSNVVLAQTENVGGWTHEWIDLSAWAGQSVELSFELNQAANTNSVWAVVDEVTVGSTNPDVWVSKDDDRATPGSEVHQRILYGNRGGAVASDVELLYTLPNEMTFVSASITPISINPLVWNLGDLLAKSDDFELEIIAKVNDDVPGFTNLESTAVINTTSTEIEQLNNQATGYTYTATNVYLPTIYR